MPDPDVLYVFLALLHSLAISMTSFLSTFSFDSHFVFLLPSLFLSRALTFSDWTSLAVYDESPMYVHDVISSDEEFGNDEDDSNGEF